MTTDRGLKESTESAKNNPFKRVISVFRHRINEIFAHLGYFAA